MRAEWVIGMCERFHVLPSQLLDEPVEVLQLLRLVKLGEPESG